MQLELGNETMRLGEGTGLGGIGEMRILGEEIERAGIQLRIGVENSTAIEGLEGSQDVNTAVVLSLAPSELVGAP